MSALLVMAALGAMMVPLSSALVERRTGAVAGARQQTVAQAIREAARHRGFWLLTLGFFVCGFQVVFIASHLPAYLADKGQPAQVGMLALALIGLFNIFGTYSAGILGGRAHEEVSADGAVRRSRDRDRSIFLAAGHTGYCRRIRRGHGIVVAVRPIVAPATVRLPA